MSILSVEGFLIEVFYLLGIREFRLERIFVSLVNVGNFLDGVFILL